MWNKIPCNIRISYNNFYNNFCSWNMATIHAFPNTIIFCYRLFLWSCRGWIHYLNSDIKSHKNVTAISYNCRMKKKKSGNSVNLFAHRWILEGPVRFLYSSLSSSKTDYISVLTVLTDYSRGQYHVALFKTATERLSCLCWL